MQKEKRDGKEWRMVEGGDGRKVEGDCRLKKGWIKREVERKQRSVGRNRRGTG